MQANGDRQTTNEHILSQRLCSQPCVNHCSFTELHQIKIWPLVFQLNFPVHVLLTLSTYIRIPTHMVLSFEKKEQLHKKGCKAIIWWGVQKKSDLLTCHTANQVMELWANVWEDATLQLSSPGHGAFPIAWPGPGRFLTGRWGVTPKFQGKNRVIGPVKFIIF